MNTAEHGAEMLRRDIEAGKEGMTQIERLGMFDARSVAAIARERVVGQDAFVEGFARGIGLAVQSAIRRMEGAASSDVPKAMTLLVMGPTASGKTYAVRQVLYAAGIPFRLVDASVLTGEGWRGSSVSDELAEVARWQDDHSAELCAILWDEADKMALKGNASGVDGSFNPQQNLLKLLDGEDRYAGRSDSRSGASEYELDCRSVINIFIGAFTGIDELVKAEVRSVGFAGGGTQTISLSEDDLLGRVTYAHLIEYGLMREFVGRIGAVFTLPALDRSSLALIVKGSAHSLEARYANTMPAGCRFSISYAARDRIADEAADTGLGARALDAAIYRIGSEALETALSDKTVCGIEIGVSKTGYSAQVARDDGSARSAGAVRELGAMRELVAKRGKSVDPDISSLMAHAVNGCIRDGLAFRLSECIRDDSAFRRLAISLSGVLGGTRPDTAPDPGLVDCIEVVMRFLYETYPNWRMTLGDVYSYCSLDKSADEASMWTPFELSVKSCSWSDCGKAGREPLHAASRRVAFGYVTVPAKFRIENARVLEEGFRELLSDGVKQGRIAAIIESEIDGKRTPEAAGTFR